jgi:cell shape-determining protein MreC
LVLSSGLGGNLPKRLVIGQVVSSEGKDVEMFREIRLQSAVNFARLETVLVILTFVPAD